MYLSEIGLTVKPIKKADEHFIGAVTEEWQDRFLYAITEI